MGSVYRALDRERNHEVALKTMHGMGPEERIRLKREFRALAHIVHPNLVNLYELVADERWCFFTMELVFGVDFVEYTRGGGSAPTDQETFVERLRHAGTQLASALQALHLGGKLHRDVKPSNVLATETGRVVLLDFGLTAPFAFDLERGAPEAFAGTVAYCAPEQLWGGPLTPAADWYGFGMTLYEAATGRLPFEGSALAVARRKRHFLVPSLRSAGYSLPPELDELIRALLHPRASERPGVERILKCLGGEAPRPYSLAPVAVGEAHVPFTGRTLELQRLDVAFERARAGALRTVHVSGTSGIGKTRLVREFLAKVRASGEALVFTSRCHPHETVAFNAIDGLVDEVSALLERSTSVRPTLSPARANALSCLFPGLERALGVSANDASELFADEVDVRLRAFMAFRELIEGLAGDRPVVLWIDDVQWGDEDSGMLLRELRRASACPLLIILSYRAEDRSASACLRVLERSPRDLGAIEHIAVGPLTDEQSVSVLGRLLEQVGTPPSTTALRLARAAEGSPYVLGEIALYLRATRGQALPEGFSLGDLLEYRLQGLPDAALRVIEILAVAGSPLEQEVGLSAAGLGAEHRGVFTSLERLSLVRTTDVSERFAELYHDRVRSEVLRRLAPSERAARHRALAQALLSMPRPNPLAAVDHFEAAGDEDSVRRHVLVAANHASKVLAFDRAARLYERALALGVSALPEHELRARLARALANAGRAREAAVAYLCAADAAPTDSRQGLEHRLGLMQRAAAQFIQSGHYAAGSAALHDVMEALDVRFPRSRRAALLQAMLLRVRHFARPLRPPQTFCRELRERERLRFDTVWSAGIRLAMIDYAASSYASARCFADALALRDRSRAMWASALEAINLVTLPHAVFQRRADRLFAFAEALSEAGAEPYDRAFVLAARGVAECFRSNFRKSLSCLDGAIALLRASSPEARFEFSLWQTWAMIALSHLGEIRELSARARAERERGEQCHDRFVLQMTDLGRPVLALLAAGEPELVMERAEQALSWAPSDYNTQHYWHFLSRVECELYRGNFEAAWTLVTTSWALHEENHFLRVVFARDELLHTRARAAIGMASTIRTARPGRRRRNSRERLLAEARVCARRIREHGLPCGVGWSLMLEGLVNHLAGRSAAARVAFRRAQCAFDEAGMQLYREVSRYALGTLEGGQPGAEKVRAAVRFMRAQGIVEPRALVRVMAPGLPERASGLTAGA